MLNGPPMDKSEALRDAWCCRAAGIDKCANAGDAALRLNMEDSHGMVDEMFSLKEHERFPAKLGQKKYPYSPGLKRSSLGARESLNELFSSSRNLDVCGKTDNGRQALELVAETKPHLADLI